MQTNLIESTLPPTEVTVQNFMAEVVQPSLQTPVVLFFYSPASPACQAFGAELETHIDSYSGALKLARVNIEKNSQIAGQFGIQSVPTTYVLVQGQPADGFAGAMQTAELTKFFARFTQGGSAAGEEEIKTALKEAQSLLEMGNARDALEIYLAIFGAFPENADAAAGIATAYMALNQRAEATDFIATLSESLQTNVAIAAIKARLAIAEQAGGKNVGTLLATLGKNPKDYETRLKLANLYFAEGKTEEAIDMLLEILGQDMEWNERAAHKQLLTFFEALGNAHPHTSYGRRRLSSLLFS